MLTKYGQGVSNDIREGQYEPTFPLNSWLKPVVVISTAGSCLFLTHYYSWTDRETGFCPTYRGL